MFKLASHSPARRCAASWARFYTTAPGKKVAPWPSGRSSPTPLRKLAPANSLFSADMDPIEITVRFDPQGQVTPLRFTWKGRRFLVESTGRQWTGADGQHILVMTGSGAMFELVFAS